MALMLRETAAYHDSDAGQQSFMGESGVVPYGQQTYGGGRGANNSSSLLPSKNIDGTMPTDAEKLIGDAEAEINELGMNPQELGQLIVSLQDEIKIIKL